MLDDLQRKLNREQFQAAATIEGPLLIIAGAGSGKTRVITHRIAYMLHSGIPQHQILALTFTNKAAREMEERVHELVGKKLRALTVSTFHAFGVNILKKHIQRLGYRPNFTIYDDGDQQSLIRECARELGVANDSIEFSKLVGLFSKIKTRRLKLAQVEDKMDRDLYLEYQERLKLYNAVDFDDLILLPIQLLEEDDEVRREYQKTFRYIMVDEFQDTSLLQYQFMHLIARDSHNVCVVGDDDQSIYSWRGANFENIRMFETDFPELLEIKLEQNYRSTGTILEAANKLIANNKNRKEKALWTPSGTGKAIELYQLQTEMDEAMFVVNTIKAIAFDDRLSYDDFGVLIRTNALSRHLEEAFMAENLPYRMSGGTSFFQRPEIKDILAYLRFISNPDDDVSLLRIINTPRRGIGKKTIQSLSAAATRHGCSLFRVICAALAAADTGEQDLFAEPDAAVSSPRRRGAGDSYWSQMGLDARPGEDGYEEDDPYDLEGAGGASAGSGAGPGEGGRRSRKGGKGGGEGLPPLKSDEVPVTPSVAGSLGDFTQLVATHRSRLLSGKGLADTTRRIIHDIDYWGFLVSEFEDNEKVAQWRQRNTELLCQSLERYENDSDNHPASIFTWLNRVALGGSEEEEDDSRGKVNLMTIHASKGLEFRVVFLVGVEDGIIPHKRSLTENEEGDFDANMEEERRLFYVAITRARQKLIMSSAKTRTQLRQTMEQTLSPFLQEIPQELIEFRDPGAEAPTEEKAEDFFAMMKDRFKPVEEESPED